MAIVSDEMSMAMAAFRVSFANSTVLANVGLFSPADVEDLWNRVSELFDAARGDRFRGLVEVNLAPDFARLREIARSKWQGQ